VSVVAPVRLARRSVLAAAALAAAGCVPPPGGVAIPPGDAATEAGADGGAPDNAPDLDPSGRHIIRVNTTAAGSADDGRCSLAEAIRASNTHAAVDDGDCPAGTGNDLILLPDGAFDVRNTLEPTESVEIRGAGRTSTVIAFASDALTCGVRLATPGKSVRLTDLWLTPLPTRPAPPALTGVCVTAGTLRIRHARVSGFTAGGLRAEAPETTDAKLELFNALVDGNTNAGDGGGIAFAGAGAWITVHESAIVGNTSGGMGGGIFVAGGTNANYIINSTLSGNVARRGGAVAAAIRDQTYVGIIGSTVAYNRALEVGGGLHITASATGAGHAFTTGAIVASNVADADPAQANLNADWEAGFSCTSSLFYLAGLARQPPNFMDSCRYDIADAKLGPLMDMGGADHLPMHALLPGSPAIDAVEREGEIELLEQRDSWNNEAGDPPLGTAPGETPPWKIFGRRFEGNTHLDIGAFEFNPRWEAELLTFAGGKHSVVTSPPGLSNGAGTRLAAAAAGAVVVYEVPVPEAGRYAITTRTGTGGDVGSWRLDVADTTAGPYVPVGAVQDGYASADGWQSAALGTIDFAAPGRKLFRFEVTDRNAASSGYNLTLDYLMVTKQ
jgi:hypothetical protein